MVNYTKWDKFDFGSDDDDSPKPRVQRLDAPSSVTFGGRKDGSVGVAPLRETKPEPKIEEVVDDDEPCEPPSDDEDGEIVWDDDEDAREDVLQCRALGERAMKQGDFAEGVRLFEKAKRIGGTRSLCPGLDEVLESARTKLAASVAAKAPRVEELVEPTPEVDERRNGGEVDGRYSWSQTKEVVEINIYVPEGAKAKAVSVDVTETTVKLSVAGTDVVFAGEWQFKVDPEEDPDWEVRDFAGRRVIRLTVKKAVLPGGLSVITWWQCVLKGDAVIDVSAIPDRKCKQASQEALTKAWQDAHASFRAKVANHKPTLIDDEGNVVEESDDEEAVAVDMQKIQGFDTTYAIREAGSGKTVTKGTTVTLHATGVVMETGKKFWSTKDAGQKAFTYKAGVGSIITGWDQGCLGMALGEVRELLIPAHEGYGERGFPAWGIGAGNSLNFTLECLDIQ